jgi:uncharacterized protein with PIN domain
MKCPKCNLEMKEMKKSITNNQLEDDGYKEYAKTLYSCEQDDVWVSVETPKQVTN